MSIIDEALQRVQNLRLPSTKNAPVSATEKPAGPEHRPAAHPWQTVPLKHPGSPLQPQTAPLTAVALAVLLLTAALIIGGAFWIGRVLATTPHADLAPGQASLTSPAPSAERGPEEATPAHPVRLQKTDNAGLVLSGVVEGLGDSYAVINGLIVAVGERVDDATLEQIAESSVTLRHDNGRKTILRVPR